MCISLPSYLRNIENFRSTREHPHCWGMNGRNFPQFPPSWSGFHGQTPPRWIVFRPLVRSWPDRLPLPALVSPFFFFLLSSPLLFSATRRAVFVPRIPPSPSRIDESSRDDDREWRCSSSTGENFEQGWTLWFRGDFTSL